MFESSPVGASELGASEPSPYHSAFERGNEPYTATKNEEMEEVKEFEVSGRAEGYFCGLDCVGEHDPKTPTSDAFRWLCRLLDPGRT